MPFSFKSKPVCAFYVILATHANSERSEVLIRFNRDFGGGGGGGGGHSGGHGGGHGGPWTLWD